ncbi:hypothetical protein [Prevotella ihumii]|uniref:hypothetical protein n=1 Tax=Prevotella ihumii TaxID=1917878 RepID=UPI0012B5DAD3|nr:hypothetical protein [Prevotella ihumii]
MSDVSDVSDWSDKSDKSDWSDWSDWSDVRFGFKEPALRNFPFLTIINHHRVTIVTFCPLWKA